LAVIVRRSMADGSTHAPTRRPIGAACFDAFYYRHCCGSPYERTRERLAFFAAVAERIVMDIQPRRVLDAGCAFGFLVEALRERGIEAEGIDLSPHAIEQVHPSIAPYCREGSIVADFRDSYNLVVAIEVLEHMPVRDGERAIENICGHTADVLFSSSPNDHREPTHVNVQPPEYWAEQFARHGFYRDLDYDASFITPWAVRFRKLDLPLHRVVREYERQFARLQLERDEAKSYALEVQQELARHRLPLPEKIRRFARRVLRRER
jgi:SAM-dependent methyltransferase